MVLISDFTLESSGELLKLLVLDPLPRVSDLIAVG